MTTIEKIKSILNIPKEAEIFNETGICVSFGARENFDKLPLRVKKLFLWMIIIQASVRNANLVSLVPEDQEVYSIIFDISIDCLKYIENKTLLMCNTAFDKSPLAIKYIPAKFIGKQMSQKAFDYDIDLFEYIPVRYKTRDMYQAYFDKYRHNLLKIYNKVKENENEMTTEEAYRANHSILSMLNKDYITKEICELAFKDDVNNIIYFPIDYITFEMMEKAFEKDVNYIKCFPRDLITKKMSEEAFKHDVNNIIYIPVRHMTQDMCNTAFNVSHKYAVHFPQKYITKQMADILFKEDYKHISIIPKECVTKQMCDCIFSEHKTDLKTYFRYFPDEYKTKEMVEFLGVDPRNSKYYPSKFLTAKLVDGLLGFSLPREEENRLKGEKKKIETEIKIGKYVKETSKPGLSSLDLKGQSILGMLDDIKNRNPKLYQEGMTKYSKDNISIVADFINSAESGKTMFSEKTGVSLSRLQNAISFVEKYFPDLYSLYKEKAIKNSEDFKEYSKRNVEYVKKNVFKPNFNIITYYLYAGMNPVELLPQLERFATKEVSNEFQKKIFGTVVPFSMRSLYKEYEKRTRTNKSDIKKFKNTTYTYKNVTYGSKENEKLINFLRNKHIPLNSYTLPLARKMAVEGSLNLYDISVSRIEYLISDGREEIRKKCKIIMEQDKVIEALDKLIENLCAKEKQDDVGADTVAKK